MTRGDKISFKQRFENWCRGADERDVDLNRYPYPENEAIP
jgi:hypothetical protein